jgi:uncharacterized Fe-S cluster protein YjdI
MKKKFEYSNNDITIIWQPDLCKHSGVCVKTLPDVYHPKDHPWIKPENASTEQLIHQVNLCPSGALSYRFNRDRTDAAK